MYDDFNAARLQQQSEETERWVRAYLKASDAGDLETLSTLIADDCEFHDCRYPPVIGAEALAEWAPKLFEGMTNQKPDALVNLAVTGRVAIGEFDFEGWHTGEYRGFPPTGKVVRWPAVLIYTFNDAGKLCRFMYYYDVQAFEAQLRGDVAAPPAPTRPIDISRPKLPADVLAAQSIETERWVKAYLKAVDDQDMAAMDQFVEDDCEFHDVRYDPIIGKEALVAWGAALFEGMPDSGRTRLVNMAVTGRTVIGEYEFSGTHSGTYLGFPATNKRIYWASCIVYHFSDAGRLASQTYYNDVESVESQLRGEPIDSVATAQMATVA
jgi:steroid delta-isomerase-like uncharacterized protein